MTQASPDFSIVTVTLNSSATLPDTLSSVARQQGVSVQHIVKDGGSTDATLALARDAGASAGGGVELITSDDIGIYDAMNQGFEAARGAYVGFLNSDDFLSFDGALSEIAALFEREGADIVYGDIEIINAQGKVARHWRSGALNNGRLKGRQLPHPAFFVRRSALAELGRPFDPSYNISADFKQQIQLINQMDKKAAYLPKTVVTMRQGGASSVSFKAIVQGWKECMRAYGEVTGKSGLGFIIGKVARKLAQVLGSRS
jgi:glycosyltransferase involved in cell wall biosynthesis